MSPILGLDLFLQFAGPVEHTLFQRFLGLDQCALYPPPGDGGAEHVGDGPQAVPFGCSPVALLDEVVEPEIPPPRARDHDGDQDKRLDAGVHGVANHLLQSGALAGDNPAGAQKFDRVAHAFRLPGEGVQRCLAGARAGRRPFLLQHQPARAILRAVPPHVGAAGPGSLANPLQNLSGHGVGVGCAQKLFGREAHAFENLVPAEDGLGHAVESLRQALDLIAAAHFGAGVKIPLSHLLHGGMQDADGPDQARGVDERDQQAQAAAENGQCSRASIGAPHALVVGIQRQADVNPAPLDAAVVERQGVLEDAASEQRRGADGTGWHSCRGAPGVSEFLDLPGGPVDHHRETIVLRHDHVVDRLIAGQNLHGLVHHFGIVLRDSGPRGNPSNRNGDAASLRFQAQLELALLFRNDDHDKNTEGDQGDQPSQQGDAQGNALREAHIVSSSPYRGLPACSPPPVRSPPDDLAANQAAARKLSRVRAPVRDRLVGYAPSDPS